MWTSCTGLLIVIIEACAAQYTGYTTLLMLSSTEGQDPYDVWQDTGSAYNSATNRSVSNLAGSNIAGYRNTMIDSWASVRPDLIRVCYRNDLGYALFCMEFNSAGSTSLDWLSKSKMTSCSNCGTCDGARDQFTSYSSSFPCSDSSTGVRKYYATTLKLSGGSIVYIVSTKSNPQILPVAEVLDTESCYLSYAGGHPLVYNQSITDLYRLYCSSVCRENNYPYGAAQTATCSCLDAEPSGAALNVCDYLCDGDNTETCGGNPAGYPVDAIVFNYVNTDVDASQFDTPGSVQSSIVLTDFKEISFTSVYFLSGYDVTVTGSPLFPLTITMEMRHVTKSCSTADFLSATLTTKTFTVSDGNTVSVDLSATKVHCVRINLSVTDGGGSDVSVSVTMTPKVFADDQFVTAKYISIQATWELEPTDSCECDCWVYNLLYGETPYDNLTYAEIEIALQNVTQQIIKELSVNTSELSSTIRKKTSADDDRASATAVGYALGVALLTFTFGGLFLSDLVRILGSFNMMKDNIMSRFGDDTDSPESEPVGRSRTPLKRPLNEEAQESL